MPSCCVEGCKNRSDTKKKSDGITFHLFPKDETRKAKWVRAVSRDAWQPSSASVVCSRHFCRSCFYHTKNGLATLLADAVPSLGVPQNNSDEPDSSEKDERMFERLPVLRPPSVSEDDPEETQLVAAEIRRLLLACKRQRKVIRMAQRKIRESSKKPYKAIRDSV